VSEQHQWDLQAADLCQRCHRRYWQRPVNTPINSHVHDPKCRFETRFATKIASCSESVQDFPEAHLRGPFGLPVARVGDLVEPRQMHRAYHCIYTAANHQLGGIPSGHHHGTNIVCVRSTLLGGEHPLRSLSCTDPYHNPLSDLLAIPGYRVCSLQRAATFSPPLN